MPPKKAQCQGARVPGRRVFLFAAAALLLAAVSACADVRFDVFLGYDEILPERSWFPITCEIYNDGPAFNAVVEITGPGQTRRMALDLPTNTRKRIFIPAFAAGRTWHARLLDERGRVRDDQQKEPSRIMPDNLPLVAALPRTASGLPVLPQSSAWRNYDSKYPVARLQTALFPDNPLALEGIDTLYLSSEKAVELSVGQVNALMAWLQCGGHLVLGIEQLTDVNATPWLRELLPCTLSSIVTVNDHDSLESWIRFAASDTLPGDAQFDSAPMLVAAGSLRDGTPLIGDSAAPLAVDGYRGRGRITVLTFSPEREPFMSWKNRAWFWSKLAGVPPAAYTKSNSVLGMAG